MISLKNTKTIYSICIPILFLCVSVMTFHSYAQTEENSAPPPSLSDILNPQEEEEVRDVPITPALLANDYFKSCVAEETLAFNEFEKQLLCGCVSAKMSELLEIEDFKHLKAKTSKGRDVRSNVLAFAYAPCMEYPMETKVTDDCMISPELRDIVSGKELVCKCAKDEFIQHMHDHANTIFTQAQKYTPTTLNPLEYYIVHLGYDSLVNTFTKKCKYDVMYEKQN